MKKTIIIIISIVLVVGLCIGGYLFLGNKDNSENITISNKKSSSDLTDVDWSKYDTYDVDLSSGKTNITKSGLYNITGSTKNGVITVDTDDNVKLVLNGITITSSDSPAIYVKNAKNVYIEVVGENNITTSTNDTLDAAIYSKSDLIIYGEGTLNIKSDKDGIASKDDLTIISGTYNIESTEDAIKGRDSVTISDGTFTINGADGIKTTNEEKGELVIDNGTFTITSTKDGIDSVNTVTLNNGTFTIKTTGNSDESSKGIKADKDIVINDGEFNITSTDDAIHSNSNVSINGGTYEISTDDDGIHADGLVEINKGTITITGHEGIEGTYVKINDGEINISASDDGINATNKSTDYETTVEINGGTITIKMGSGDTDGIDSNGDLYINGGTINITGQSPFDYDGEAKLSGGKLIVNGEETDTIINQFMGGNMGGQDANGGTPDAQGSPNQNAGMQNRGGMRR